MAKPKIPVNMDKKSANPGDRMKHALSEILARTAAWPNVTYSETHAGAGIYREANQKPAKPYIRNLRERVLWLLRPTIDLNRNASSARTQPVAGAYLELLGQWWLKPEQFELYPGSATQAGEYLTTMNREFSLRLTEADPLTCQRLQAAVQGFPGEVRCCSFEDEIDWLTEPDRLCLVVDPFRCVDSFLGHGESLDGKFDVTKGDIDHDIVRDILLTLLGQVRSRDALLVADDITRGDEWRHAHCGEFEQRHPPAIPIVEVRG